MMVAEVLRTFNSRNATELARRLQVSRATVYRWIKQPGARTHNARLSGGPPGPSA